MLLNAIVGIIALLIQAFFLLVAYNIGIATYFEVPKIDYFQACSWIVLLYLLFTPVYMLFNKGNKDAE